MAKALTYTFAAIATLTVALLVLVSEPPTLFGAIQNLGNTANDASVQTNSNDRKYVNPATAGASGTVVSGVARIWNGGTVSSNTNLVIYSNTSGTCATTETLLAVSDTLAVASGTTEAARNYTFSGANQISITNGTSYCIGVHFSDPGTGNISISRANTGASVVKSDGDTYSDGPTATCSCTTSSNGPLNLYVEFDDTPVASGAPSTELILIN